MQSVFDVRFWATTLICAAILWALVPARHVKHRGTLIGFVAISWSLSAMFQFLPYLIRNGHFTGEEYRNLTSFIAAPSAMVAVVGWLLLLAYAWSVRISADSAQAERRVEFELKLADGSEHDLVDLAEDSVISVAATGRNITQVVARAQNLTAHPLRVVAVPGTCFASSGAHQNMVTTETIRFALQPRSTEEFTVRAACVNANRPIPGEADRFKGVYRVSATLKKFLENAVTASPMARQAGVWAITDNFTAGDVQSHLHVRDQLNNQRSAVSDKDIADARKILDAIGVRHRL